MCHRKTIALLEWWCTLYSSRLYCYLIVLAGISSTPLMCRINEPWRQKTYLRTCALSEDSDQPAHLRSLIRIFTGRNWDTQGCKVYSYGQGTLWSDCANAQADSSLRWEHMSEVTFSHVAAQIFRTITRIIIRISSSRYKLPGWIAVGIYLDSLLQISVTFSTSLTRHSQLNDSW